MADLSRLVEISRNELLQWQSEEPFYQPLKYLIIKKDEMLGLSSSENVLSHRLNFIGNVSSLNIDDEASVLSTREEEEYNKVEHVVEHDDHAVDTRIDKTVAAHPSPPIEEVEEVDTNTITEEQVIESQNNDVLIDDVSFDGSSSTDSEHLNVSDDNTVVAMISEVHDDNEIVAENASSDVLESESEGKDVVSVDPIMHFKQEVSSESTQELDPAVTAQELVVSVEPKKSKKLKKKKKKKKFKEKQLHSEYSEFTSWLSAKQKGKSAKKLNKKKDKKKISKKERIIKEAEKSNYRDTTVISETLANILANQGHIKEAIEMYEQLSLLIVEKSSYFADRIQELKKR